MAAERTFLNRSASASTNCTYCSASISIFNKYVRCVKNKEHAAHLDCCVGASSLTTGSDKPAGEEWTCDNCLPQDGVDGVLHKFGALISTLCGELSHFTNELKVRVDELTRENKNLKSQVEIPSNLVYATMEKDMQDNGLIAHVQFTGDTLQKSDNCQTSGVNIEKPTAKKNEPAKTNIDKVVSCFKNKSK